MYRFFVDALQPQPQLQPGNESRARARAASDRDRGRSPSVSADLDADSEQEWWPNGVGNLTALFSEAQLTVRLTDHPGAQLERTLRVVLTTDSLSDLPDPDDGAR